MGPWGLEASRLVYGANRVVGLQRALETPGYIFSKSTQQDLRQSSPQPSPFPFAIIPRSMNAQIETSDAQAETRDVQAETRDVHIEPADAKLRVQVLGALGATCLLAVAGILLLDRHLQNLLALGQEDPIQAMERIHAVAIPLFWAVGLGSIVIGLWTAKSSWKVFTHARFPAPGARVIRDTRVVTGTSAKGRGVLGMIVAVILVVLGLLLPQQAERMLKSLLDTRPLLEPTPVHSQWLPSPGSSSAPDRLHPA